MSLHRMIVPLTAFVLAALALAACAPTAPITGITWKWTSSTGREPSDNIQVPNPENFTITLSPDGSIGIRNDCNSAGGTFDVSGTSLRIALGATTLAYCGDDSLDTSFAQQLSRVDSFRLDQGRLILQFADGEGQMVFER